MAGDEKPNNKMDKAVIAKRRSMWVRLDGTALEAVLYLLDHDQGKKLNMGRVCQDAIRLMALEFGWPGDIGPRCVWCGGLIPPIYANNAKYCLALCRSRAVKYRRLVKEGRLTKAKLKAWEDRHGRKPHDRHWDWQTGQGHEVRIKRRPGDPATAEQERGVSLDHVCEKFNEAGRCVVCGWGRELPPPHLREEDTDGDGEDQAGF